MDKSNYLLIIILLMQIGCTQKRDKLTYEPKFVKSELTTHKIKEGQEFTFGYLEVPENRQNPNTKTIKLPVYIFKSRSENPNADPVIYTVGGPGYTSMRASQYMKYYKYLDDRDLILFEQRGTQFAQPNLACPEWSKAVYQSNLPKNRAVNSDSIFNNAALRCRERLVNSGIDLNGYHTKEIAADIEDLRRVLNIEKYNFLSLSYSTKIAQVLLREYPETIRSVVMDSPLPLESNYDEVSVTNLYNAINKLLDDCESDHDCNRSFPNLKSRYFEFLRATNENPLEITMTHPKDKTEEVVRLRGKDLISLFSNASTGDVPTIPLEISKLLNGDYSTIKEQLSFLFREPNNGDGRGMRLSVWCAEEFPFTNPDIVNNQKTKHPELTGLSSAVFSSDVCNIWKVRKANEIENKPVKSDVPVLLISGEYDEDTPPYFAEMLSDNFVNSHHLVFKGWKHGPTTNWSNPCAMNCANTFFNNPFEEPDIECYRTMKKPKFITE